LAIIQEYVPLEIDAVPSGGQVFDWTIPKEWRIRDAYLLGPDGRKYADFKRSNLSVVNYSEPVDTRIGLTELKGHLHSIPSLPGAIPYVTSYYSRYWGFCLPHRTLEQMPDGEYHAYIDSEFVDGNLNYGHYVLSGETSQEVLLSSYLCHPSLANNELSGPLVLLLLYRRIVGWKRRRFTYRFILCPETIGSITYLAQHGATLKKNVISGLVLTCLGGRGSLLSYKMSRMGTSLIDKTVLHGKRHGMVDVRVRPFTPTGGSDERQYCSPGFNLPVGQMARAVYGEYDGYHNSLDTKDFMDLSTLIDSANQLEGVLQALEYAGYFINLKPYGEVQLGRRNLYPNINSDDTRSLSTDQKMDNRTQLNNILMILNYCDGNHSMIDIAEMCGISVQKIAPFVDLLEHEKLLTLQVQ
jgi:aminopeptidase-like protein